MKFIPVTLADKGMIDEYLNRNKFTNSEYNFANWFAAGVPYDIKYTIVEGCLCIIQRVDSVPISLIPLGDKDKIANALDALIKYFANNGDKLVLMYISEEMVQLLEDINLLHKFDIEKRIDMADYICKKENITTMKGRKLNKVRNDFNHFTKNYNYEFVPLTKENEDTCLKMVRDIIKCVNQSACLELNHTLRAIQHREELGLKSSTLYIDGKMSGVILGQNLHGMALINYARAYTTYRGIYHMMYKFLIEEYFADLPYVNLMEDLGFPGLRQAKSSFNPEPLVYKSVLTLK